MSFSALARQSNQFGALRSIDGCLVPLAKSSSNVQSE
jgi:hypothetical protein